MATTPGTRPRGTRSDITGNEERDTLNTMQEPLGSMDRPGPRTSDLNELNLPPGETVRRTGNLGTTIDPAGTTSGTAARTSRSFTSTFAIAAIVLLAAFLMLRPAPATPARPHRRHWAVIALEGLTVGVITGLVGVGGGFLILPALVLLGGLPMGLAVGTSLVIIALKSASGFYKYLTLLPLYNLSVNWGLVLLFAVLGSLGSLVGHQLARRLPQARLRQVFAAFLIAMGIFILGQNLATLLG